MSLSKIAIVTRSDSRVSEMTSITHPVIHKYAKSCNADFIILEKPYMFDCIEPLGIYHYRIMYLYDMLLKYDRILMIDSDVLINKNCPNLFDTIPRGGIGTIFEDKGSRKEERVRRINEIQTSLGDVGWRENYINTGVFMVSKEHRDIFDNSIDPWVNKGFDDIHLGYQIHKKGYKIYVLPFQYNHMTMFSEPWNGSANRFNSAIIHYAGNGCFDSCFSNRLEQIRSDYESIGYNL